MEHSIQPWHVLFGMLVAVVSLIVLVARFRVHAFVALLLSSIVAGVCCGLSLPKIADAFQQGIGSMLGSIAGVVGLGMILGKLLERSGGAEVIAGRLIQAWGTERLPWGMMAVGFLVGIPVFFTVGVVLLVPVLLTLVRDSRQPLLALGIPLVAGLSVVHGLVPPHPGPMAAIGLTHADPGKVILYSLIVGLPTAALAGPVFARFISLQVRTDSVLAAGTSPRSDLQTITPGFGISLCTILLPIGLMLLATAADLVIAKEHPARTILLFVGHPLIAMLVATLFAFYTFGVACGYSRLQLSKMVEDCLGPAAAILLVVGAGGGFNRVLAACGVADAISTAARSAHFSPLFLSWLVAVLIRIATGSATVAITTSAGIVAPFAAETPGCNLELLVVAMGAGSLILSHVNDGGFWFVKEYFGLTVPETLRTWTVVETIISVVAFLLVLLLDAVIA